MFTNVLLVDELNRATPKTQSGLLEAMQERQVTVDGHTRPIEAPFTVIATQNPTAGHDGTYPLPPAQLDRFMTRVCLGYPTRDQELSLLRGGAHAPAVLPVGSPARLLAAQAAAADVHTSDALLRYIVAILEDTRRHPLAAVGASPRAGLLLAAAARARAALAGREFVVPDDVQALAGPVLVHRIQPAPGAPDGAQERVVADALDRAPRGDAPATPRPLAAARGHGADRARGSHRDAGGVRTGCRPGARDRRSLGRRPGRRSQAPDRADRAGARSA